MASPSTAAGRAYIAAGVGGDRVRLIGDVWTTETDAILAIEAESAARQPVPEADALRDGAARIAAERRRQIESEGYTASHDAGHGDELAMAAAAYAVPDRLRKAEERSGWVTVRVALWRLLWPWNERYWKPSDDRIRELEKAGALIAAAIDAALATRSPQ